MKIDATKDYGLKRFDDPKDLEDWELEEVATKKDFCCKHLFNASVDLHFEDDDYKNITMTVLEGEFPSGLPGVQYCPFCGEKFELVE